ncbi:hypothetical protein [Rufibacter roseus]|uniref:DUF4367 domain-containing protein n=1 Tax=Rufibacter roseus TaxID=1567108 RepID=A0ABW2DPP0_9BACT|nr:hypothetical protein [Rufibacter roseus]
MKKALLAFLLVLMLLPTLSYAQAIKEERSYKIELPCLYIKDTLRFNLPKGFKKKNVFWYGEGFIQSYNLESGAELRIICGGLHAIPALTGKQYIVTSINGKKKRGTIRKSNLFWREEDFLGIIVLYINASEEDKNVLDKIVDGISAQVEKK